MTVYYWPANVAMAGGQVVLTFHDWPELSASGKNITEAILNAGLELNKAVLARIQAKASFPSPSDLGPRQIPIYIASDVAAQLEGHLEERQAIHFRLTAEQQQARQSWRAAFLTEFRANLDPIERLTERLDASATEFASIGIRFCYILNAGGLVAIPAIMEILPDKKLDHTALLLPSLVFVIGVLTAALANYLAYLSVIKTSESWSHESDARAMECTGAYYPPDDLGAHQTAIAKKRLEHQKKLNSADLLANSGVCAFAASILAFLGGVGLAIQGLW